MAAITKLFGALAMPVAAALSMACLIDAAAAKPKPAKPTAPATAPNTSGAADTKAPASSPASAPILLNPRGWGRAIYAIDGRVQTSIKDVTFEAPPAYQESFTFWTNRMKGGQRAELFNLLTTTTEPAEDGSLPFHRQVSRYQLDMYDKGEMKVGDDEAVHEVTNLAWEGALDAKGNIKELRLVRHPDEMRGIQGLSFQRLDEIYPRLTDRRQMKVGESFVEEIPMPLPQRLTVHGLEEVGIKVSRRMTLKQVNGQEAIFDVNVTYVANPATPPSAPRTSMTIGGGGDGQATFDMTDGLFTSARLASVLSIDIEAPLRKLPDQPEGSDPGTAKSHIEMAFDFSARQSLSKLFMGEEPNVGEPKPATPNGETPEPPKRPVRAD